MVYPSGLGRVTGFGCRWTYSIWAIVMAIPLAKRAGKLATLAAVMFPPAFLVVPRPEVKSNNH